MDKGWGLTLDSDQVSFFSSKQANFSSNNHHKRGIMFPGIEFPVSLSRREGQAASAPAVSDEDRTVVSEVDFFSDKNKGKDKESKGVINVKKENSHEEGPRIDLDVNTGLRLRTTNTGSDQSMVDDGVSSDAEDKRAKNELAVLQAELERMNSENQRLTAMLSQVSNNYNALQMHLVALMQQQQQQQQNSNAKSIHEKEIAEAKFEDKKQQGGVPVVPRQFMELGPSCATETEEQSQSSSEERTHSGSLINHNNKKEIVQFDQEKNKGIQRDGSPESESWAPNKVPKLSEPKPVDHATEATMRKARVSVRARSEAPMITDGCQWRKYGQKMAKGNPCPRAYYRCTMALGCPVRKQVQRCAEDKAILITTYEGTHNHPLPPAAVAMASTTSAAANMLLSGSMPSGDGLMNPNFLARAILPCSSSVATISASAPFPTVTLDLTHNTNPLQFQRPPPQFNMPFHGQAPNFTNVAAPPQAAHVFGQALYNQSKFSGLQLSQDMDQSAQLGQQMQNPSFADTLSAATAAITADPNFTAALAAAISSIIGGGHPNSSNNNNTTSTTATTNTSCSNGNKIGGFPGN